jgi:hypothetical protein
VEGELKATEAMITVANTIEAKIALLMLERLNHGLIPDI